MCGIFVSELYDKEVISLVAKRGLDSFNCIKYQNLYIASSVLSIRDVVQQPICTEKYVFVYNGEIYNDEMSDTLFIKEVIDNILSEDDTEEILQKIHSKLNFSQNEFSLAIVYNNKVLFFKDDVGKKSVGLKKDKFQLSSVFYDIELDNSLLYSYDLNTKNMTTFIKNKVLIKYLLKSRSVIEKYIKNGCTTTNAILEDFAQFNITKSKKINFDEFDFLLRQSFKRRLIDNNLVVFFSGGVDSILVALYLHLVSDPLQTIILINTGFKNSYDRINGFESYKELNKIFNNRNWRFVEVNLDIEKIREVKDDIYKLIFPKTGGMDFNIGVVLHFTSVEARNYSKVCYLGSGADELFCGYNKYNKENNDASRKRMLFDTLTLSYHNLSRDDRIISNSNLEIRLPLLDTEVINSTFLIDDQLLKNEVENKVVVREILRKYGLKNISKYPKKAMQYGTGLNKFEKRIIN